MRAASAIGAGVLALFLATAPFAGAGAQTKGALTAAELQKALADAGLSPSMMEDAASGEPVAKGMAGEFEFNVRAFDCKGRPLACETFMFFATFSIGHSLTPNDLVILNRFNEKQVFGRAYFIEESGRVGVDYVVELEGGVTADHLSRNVARWTDVMAAFVEHMRSGRDSS